MCSGARATNWGAGQRRGARAGGEEDGGGGRGGDGGVRDGRVLGGTGGDGERGGGGVQQWTISGKLSELWFCYTTDMTLCCQRQKYLGTMSMWRTLSKTI